MTLHPRTRHSSEESLRNKHAFMKMILLEVHMPAHPQKVFMFPRNMHIPT